MHYVVYRQWVGCGVVLTKIKELQNKAATIEFITGLQEQKMYADMKYELILVVEGQAFEARIQEMFSLLPVTNISTKG